MALLFFHGAKKPVKLENLKLFKILAAALVCPCCCAPCSRVCQLLPRHSTAWHGTARHGTAWHSMAQCGTVQHGTARCGMAQHSVAWHRTARHGTARSSTARHSLAQHGMEQHSTAGLSCTVQVIEVMPISSNGKLHCHYLLVGLTGRCSRNVVTAADGRDAATSLSAKQTPRVKSHNLILFDTGTKLVPGQESSSLRQDDGRSVLRIALPAAAPHRP